MPNGDAVKRLTIALLCLALTACASGPTVGADYRAYVATNKPLAEAGTMKWSEYYVGAYDEAAKAGAPGHVLRDLNRLAGIAGQYEAGQLTRSDFEYQRRGIMADAATAFEADQARYVEAQQRQQALGAAQMAAGLQMMQARGPAAIQQPAMPVVGGMLRGQSVSGMLRYCSYSNGVVNTISSVALCPMSTP